MCVRGFLKPTSIIRDAESVRCELQASRGGVDRSWTLEAEKQRRGDPPAIKCRFLQSPHGNSGLDRRLQAPVFFFACRFAVFTEKAYKQILYAVTTLRIEAWLRFFCVLIRPLSTGFYKIISFPTGFDIFRKS